MPAVLRTDTAGGPTLPKVSVLAIAAQLPGRQPAGLAFASVHAALSGAALLVLGPRCQLCQVPRPNRSARGPTAAQPGGILQRFGHSRAAKEQLTGEMEKCRDRSAVLRSEWQADRRHLA